MKCKKAYNKKNIKDTEKIKRETGFFFFNLLSENYVIYLISLINWVLN